MRRAGDPLNVRFLGARTVHLQHPDDRHPAPACGVAVRLPKRWARPVTTLDPVTCRAAVCRAPAALAAHENAR